APMDYPVDPLFDVRTSKIIYEDLIARFAKFTSLLNRNSYLWTVFGTDIGVDPAAVQDLRRSLQNDYKIATSYEPVESVNNLLLKMSELDYVVTCRFHGVVFAHLLNKPVLAISPHPKVANLMNDIGLSEYCVNINSFDSDLLLRRFSLLARNGESIKGVMAETLDGFRRKLASQ